MKLICKSFELARLRMKKGMTCAGLSKEIGLEKCTISNLESGKRNVKAPTAIKICSFLSVELEDLFDISR